MYLHPARTIPFNELYLNLELAVGNKLVRRITDKALPDLVMYHYTEDCVKVGNWDTYTLLARGLIIDEVNQKVIATPFPKFFNYGQISTSLPDEPFTVHEKMDGSLGIFYYYQGEWRMATKGAFYSPQADWGQNYISFYAKAPDLLDITHTYLFEIIYPQNKIVVDYDFEGVVLLGGYEATGRELSPIELRMYSACIDVTRPRTFLHFNSINEICKVAESLDKNQEGFIVHYPLSGYRTKIKGAEYLRIHRVVSNITPLKIWQLLLENPSDEAITKYRSEIPDEFLVDFHNILRLLRSYLSSVVATVEFGHDLTEDMTDKEVGLILQTSTFLSPIQKSFIFSRRKYGKDWYMNPKIRRSAFEYFRPDQNTLIGYTPSRYLNRLRTEVKDVSA